LRVVLRDVIDRLLDRFEIAGTVRSDDHEARSLRVCGPQETQEAQNE
jgi:hypothetical protein